MAETLLEELKRYIGFDAANEAALRRLHPVARPSFERIATVFYDRILAHEGASKALHGGESEVGRLKVTLVAWMDKLLAGPWDEGYYEMRCRIGRVHVRIALPQHYMFGAMNVVRSELQAVIDTSSKTLEERQPARLALNRILDLELAIMLHTYREDLLAQQSRTERLSTFGQLVGSIGHELRNPLGVIESSLYILKGRVQGDDRAQKHMDRIADQVNVSNRIVSSLLDMIRDRPLQREDLRLGAVVEQAAAALSRPDGVRLHPEGLTDLAVLGDPVQLKQVFVNLLENAFHACASGGDVWVRGRGAGDAVEVRVEDTGKGVDPSIAHRLFEPLITTKTRGIGLGLALVRRMAERHGGTIRYEPRPEGGSAFTLRLPKSP
jgi:signal transduction histidine kinase